jgi:hypothetical protein
MSLRLTDLPSAVSEAYSAATVRSDDNEILRKLGAAVDVQAVTIVDNQAGVIYTTRDSGQSFDAEQFETIHIKGDTVGDMGIVVRRVLETSDLQHV